MSLFGIDPVNDAVEAALDAIERGENPPERRLYDFKEETGRRGPGGALCHAQDWCEAEHESPA